MDCVSLVLGHDLDPLADLLFAFAMSHVLFEIYADLDDAGCLQLPEEMPVGTTWADDTCILLAGAASTIDSRLASSFSIVHQALLRHGLSPSYGPGKTAAVLNYRGRDSARYHRRRFASATPSIPCLVEHGESIELAVALLMAILCCQRSGQEVPLRFRPSNPFRSLAWPILSCL